MICDAQKMNDFDATRDRKHIYKIGLGRVGVSRRVGEEVAKVADFEEGSRSGEDQK